MDSKVIYLAKTLSRTKRKDYENYVVNAIWNRINDSRLVPVSQQYVKDRSGNYYFIDLYFPQLKIGIECDEGYHTSHEQKVLDAEREATIIDVMKQVDGCDYIALHVDVTKTFEEVEEQINAHVLTIKSKVEELNIQDGWNLTTKEIKHGWSEEESDIAEYFKDKEYITINDNIVFPRNKDVYNIILGQNFAGSPAHSGEPWKKLHTRYGYEEGTFPWFPQLTIQKPTSSGYFNILSKDGTEIYEYIDDPEQNMQRKAEGRYIGKKRVVFTKAKDPLTGIKGYRFVGFFIGNHYDENGTITYKRIDDKFRIIKKKDNTNEDDF